MKAACYTYRLHDTTGDDLGLIEHPAPNVEPGAAVILADGRESLVIYRLPAALVPATAVSWLPRPSGLRTG